MNETTKSQAEQLTRDDIANGECSRSDYAKTKQSYEKWLRESDNANRSGFARYGSGESTGQW